MMEWVEHWLAWQPCDPASVQDRIERIEAVVTRVDGLVERVTHLEEREIRKPWRDAVR